MRRLLHDLPQAVVREARGHDLMLYSAGVTFYSALAVLPVLFVATRVLAAILGRPVVLDLAENLSRALPSELGANRVALLLVDQGTTLSWPTVVLSVLPASLYGEGLRRAYSALADSDDRLVGWRGRLAVLPLLAAAPGLLLCVLLVTPLLADLFGKGPGGVALGVYVALNVDWLVVSLPLAWTYRVVASDPPPWRAALVGGFATGAFVAGFLQGFVLFLALPLDLGAPFGGQVPVGAVCAVLLWLLVLHLVVLVGWVATRSGHRLWLEQSPPAPAAGDATPDTGDAGDADDAGDAGDAGDAAQTPVVGRR